MRNPAMAYKGLQESVFRYIETAFGTRSESFEEERRQLLAQEGNVFREALIEPIFTYASGQRLEDLQADDLPGLDPTAADAFRALCSAGLFQNGYPLYTHQQEMLRKSLAGQHCVITTGTGSGKTESFLLPLLASLVRETKEWEAARPNTQRINDWWSSTGGSGAKWHADKRRNAWGETRIPALRSVILYPMNALVEDQLSRLRTALDSDETHEAYCTQQDYFRGNKITFARYNSETPVAGHPIKPNGDSNGSKRAELGRQLIELRRTYEALVQKRNNAQGNPELLKQANELMSFFPRVDGHSAEMLHRWEMQRFPPDILVTNFSMLSIMLMRHKDPALQFDQSDGDMIDQTRNWLAGDRCRENPQIRPTRIFHLVVDELHLYR